MLLCVILDAVLHVDHAVHEAERLEVDIIRLDDADAFADSAQGIPAVADDGVSNLLRELRVAHPRVPGKRAINPLLVRVGEGVQFLYGFRFLTLRCHLPCREICGREAFEYGTDAGIFVFRDECGFHIIRASVFSLSPYGSAASATSHDRALFEIELVIGENVPADVFGDEYGGTVFCVCL